MNLQHGWKKSRIGLMLVSLLFSLLLFFQGVVPAAQAFTDTNALDDSTFFGVWNAGTSTWTTPGKINYAYSPNLAPVEAAVKNGDYAAAKQALLTYYKNRTDLTAQPFTSSDRYPSVARLAMNNVFKGYGDGYIGDFTVTNAPASAYSVDVTPAVKGVTTKAGIYLMGKYKSDSESTFASREAGDHAPVLQVVVNGQTKTLTPDKDTYIRPGKYGNTNYGTSSSLLVRESGAPFDDNEERTYLTFDLSSLGGKPDSATLVLYGGITSGLGDPGNPGKQTMMVFSTGDLSWNETAKTWNNTLGQVFSWSGIATGTNWNQPSSGADQQWVHTVKRMEFVGYLTAEYTLGSHAEAYANKAIELMLDYMADKGNDNTPSDANNSLDTGLRTSGWVKSYNVLRNSSSMDAEANTSILKYLWKTGAFLGNPNWESPPLFSGQATFHHGSNWGISETEGLYKLAVYFPEFVDSSKWKDLANKRLDEIAGEFVYPDGSYVEASSSYGIFALEEMTAVEEFGIDNGQTFDASFSDTMKKLANYLMNMSYPDGYDTQYGDADHLDNRPPLGLVGQLFHDPGLQYFASGGKSGAKPAYTSILYPSENEMAIMRSGWDANSLYMNINNASADGGFHGHTDNLALDLYAYGKELLIDPGRGDYSGSAQANWLRLRSQAHNTIEVDNTAQTKTNGKIDSWVTNNSYDFFEGSSNSYLENGVTPTRSVLFIKPGYWIVSDYLKGDGAPHTYNQTWHFLPDANPALDPANGKAKTQNSNQANLQIVPADPDSLTASLQSGYYSPVAQNVTNATYLSYVKQSSQDVTFDTVLYPTTATDSRDVQVSRLELTPDVASAKATALQIKLDPASNGQGGNVGYYYLSHEPNPAESRPFGDFTYNGQMAYVETTHSGIITSALMKSGRTLLQHNKKVIDYGATIPDIGIQYNDKTLQISGSSLVSNTDKANAIAIYGPTIKEVTLNGQSVPFTKHGDYIYAVSPSIAVSKADYSGVVDLGAGNNGVQSIAFDVRPNAANMDNPLIGISGSSMTVQSYKNVGILLRMSSAGTFEALNGANWSAANALSYEPDTWYHVRLVADLNSHTYDAFVAPIGGSEIQIASGYSFNTDPQSEPMDDVGKLYVKSATDNQFILENAAVANLANTTRPIADAWGDKNIPNTNYGTNSNLIARGDGTGGYDKKAYLKFGLFQIGEVKSAKLRLYISRPVTPATVNVYAVSDNSWREGTLTFNNGPAPGAQIASLSAGNVGYYDFDVTSYVKSQVEASQSLVSFMLGGIKGGPTVFFNSKESPSGQPLLIINGSTVAAQP